MNEAEVLAGRRTPRPLPQVEPAAEVWFVVDTSGSMNLKLDDVAYAIRRGLGAAAAALGDDDSHVAYRLVRFSTGAEWVVGRPIPVAANGTTLASFYVPDLRAGGTTDLGKALGLVAAEIEARPGDATAGTGVLVVVITDGQPTDDYRRGVARVRDAIHEAAVGQSFPLKFGLLAYGLGGDADLQPLLDLAEVFPTNATLVAPLPQPDKLRYALQRDIGPAVLLAMGRMA